MFRLLAIVLKNLKDRIDIDTDESVFGLGVALEDRIDIDTDESVFGLGVALEYDPELKISLLLGTFVVGIDLD
jgi:hypothetical protein